MIQAPQLYVLHPHMAPSSPKTPHPVPQAYIQFPAQKMPAWRASGSWWHIAAHSGSLRSTGTTPKALPVYQASHPEHLSRPPNPSVVPSFWLADEVTETDYNHLNNSWSPRL